MYVVKWRHGGDWDTKPYLVDAGQSTPKHVAPTWTGKQKEARRFASVEEAKQHVRSAYANPKKARWLTDGDLLFVRLIPRQPASTS